jgi:hypothetical protein
MAHVGSDSVLPDRLLVDDISIRVYTSAVVFTVITVDLNPATVQASYPALTLNAADFTFDGSNAVQMAIAYEQVVSHAVSLQLGGGVQVNELTTISLSTGVSIQFQLHHAPLYPYALFTFSGDADYVAPVGTGAFLEGYGNANRSTETSSFNIESCGDIFTQEQGVFLDWEQSNPLQLVPNPSLTSTIIEGLSNAVRTCSASPAFCAELATSSVALDGCITICDTLDVRMVPFDTLSVQVVAMPADTCGVKVPGHRRLTSFSDTYAADTYNSLSLTVISGTVSVTIDGITVEYPSGYSARWAAPDPCDRLSESFLIDANNGSVIIASLQ